MSNGGVPRRLFIDNGFDRSDAVALVARSPIEDMRPRHRGELRYLADSDNFEQVVRFIYQIRCNLFHGGKSPIERRDADLVVLGGEEFLGKWIREAYLQSDHS